MTGECEKLRSCFVAWGGSLLGDGAGAGDFGEPPKADMKDKTMLRKELVRDPFGKTEHRSAAYLVNDPSYRYLQTLKVPLNVGMGKSDSEWKSEMMYLFQTRYW